MLKRLVYIALFTGLGQLISIFTLKYLSQSGFSGQLKPLAEIDSIFFFIITIIALGLQPSAMRHLTLTEDWKPAYAETQSARVTFSLVLMALATLSIFNDSYLLFLISPVLALNSDYALYARGFSIMGALIACIRLVIPFSLVILFAQLQPAYILTVYVVSLTATYLLTNIYISFYLKTAYWFRPKLRSLKLYLSSLSLGLVSLSLYIIGLGVLLVVPYFYDDKIVSTAFVGLKFYVLYKGVLRIIHQAFLKEMTDEHVCLKVDQLSAIVGIVFAGSIFIFPETFISLFFGVALRKEALFFGLLGVAGIIYASYLSMATKSILDKKDKIYTMATVPAAVVALVSPVVLSFFYQSAVSIAVSILLGELIWTIGLIRINRPNKLLSQRINFTIQISSLLLIPLAIRFLWKDNLPAYVLSFGLYALVLAGLFYKRFNLEPRQ